MKEMKINTNFGKNEISFFVSCFQVLQGLKFLLIILENFLLTVIAYKLFVKSRHTNNKLKIRTCQNSVDFWGRKMGRRTMRLINAKPFI